MKKLIALALVIVALTGCVSTVVVKGKKPCSCGCNLVNCTCTECPVAHPELKK